MDKIPFESYNNRRNDLIWNLSGRRAQRDRGRRRFVDELVVNLALRSHAFLTFREYLWAVRRSMENDVSVPRSSTPRT